MEGDRVMARASTRTETLVKATPGPACCVSPRVLVDDRGMITCHACGTCFGPDLVNDLPRAYSSEEQSKRWHAAPFNKAETSLLQPCTTANPERKIQWFRMQKQHCIDQGACRASRYDWFVLRSIITRLGLPPVVIDDARRVHVMARSMHLARGHDSRDFIAASIVAGARIHGIIITLREASDAAGRPVKRVFIASRLITRAVLPAMHVLLPALSIRALISRRVDALHLPWKRVACILAAGRAIDEHPVLVLAGKMPAAIAAAIVHLATREDGHGHRLVLQKAVARTFNVTEATIRNIAKIIEPLGLIKPAGGGN